MQTQPYLTRGSLGTEKSRKRRALMKRDGTQCYYCGRQLSHKTATLDHIIPKSAGGTGRLDNLVLACASCNVKKGNGTGESVIRKLKQLTTY